MFAAEKDRRHEVGFTEEGHLVAILPDVTTLGDVDSLNAEGAVITLNYTLDGDDEGLGVDEQLASGFGINVMITRSEGRVTMKLSGIASFQQYRQVMSVVGT